MSAVLLDQVQTYIRSQFTKSELVTVEPYAGEFNTDEMKKESFNCPAVFVTVLGWKPLHGGTRLTGKYARDVKVAAFVVTKHPKRQARMRQAMVLSEKLGIVLRNWVPDNTQGLPITIGPLEDDAGAENLYGQAIDRMGLAVWLVDWDQAVKPVLDQVSGAPVLLDWLSVAIEDTARVTTPPQAPEASSTLVVTEKITFPTNT